MRFLNSFFSRRNFAKLIILNLSILLSFIMKVPSVFVLWCWISSILLLTDSVVQAKYSISSAVHDEQSNRVSRVRGRVQEPTEIEKPKRGKHLDLDLYQEALDAIFYGDYTPEETKQIIDHVGKNFIRSEVVDPEKTGLAFAFEKVQFKSASVEPYLIESNSIYPSTSSLHSDSQLSLFYSRLESSKISVAKEARDASALIRHLLAVFALEDTFPMEKKDAETTTSAPMTPHALLMNLEDSVLILIQITQSFQCINVVAIPTEAFEMAQLLTLLTDL